MILTRRYLTFAPLALGVLGYAAFAAFSNSSGDFFRVAARMSAPAVSLILGLSMLNYALRFARWQYYLRTLSHRVPWSTGFLYYLAGFAFTTTPGKMGEAVRAVYFKQRGVPYMQSLAMLFVERLSDLAAMLVLSTLALRAFPHAGAILAATIAFIALLFIVFTRSHAVMAWLGPVLPRGITRRAEHRLHDLRSLLGCAAQLLRARMLLAGLGLALLSWGAEGLSLYYILQVLGTPLAAWTAVSIYAVSVLVGALSFLPGGLGSTEAAMALLLVLAGVDHASATAATLICRLATLWFAVALGALAMLGSGTRRPVAETDTR